MAEYIEREAAINWIYELIKARQKWLSDARGEIQGLNAAMCGIEDIPSADVAPVRHGRWDDFKPGMPLQRKICSECGHITNPWLVQVYNFCPICGAKMDGGET